MSSRPVTKSGRTSKRPQRLGASRLGALGLIDSHPEAVDDATLLIQNYHAAARSAPLEGHRLAHDLNRAASSGQDSMLFRDWHLPSSHLHVMHPPVHYEL